MNLDPHNRVNMNEKYRCDQCDHKHPNKSATKNAQLFEILFRCEQCDHKSTQTHLNTLKCFQCDKWTQKGSPKSTLTGPAWKDQI